MFQFDEKEETKRPFLEGKRYSFFRWIVQLACLILVNYVFFETYFGLKMAYLESIVKVLPFLQTPRGEYTPGAGLLEYSFLQMTQGTIPFLMIGIIILIGLFGGRIACGWLCPTGLIQDVLYRLPSENKRFKIQTDKTLKKVKFYVLLLLFIIVLPLAFLHGTTTGFDYAYSLGVFGERPESVFSLSEFIFAFIPQMFEAMNSAGGFAPLFYSAIGAVQFFAFIVIIILCILYPRFYCRALCPYGAMLGIVSEFSLIHLGRNPVRCPGRKECGICERVCPNQIRILDERWEGFSGSGECNLCLECKEKCPHGAVVWRWN